MVRLLIYNTWRLPLRLGLFRIASATRRRPWRGFTTFIWVVRLLMRLDELDEGPRDHLVVALLEVL